MQKLKKALSTETSETKKMLRIYKNRKTASKSDIKFANDQFKDILKVQEERMVVHEHGMVLPLNLQHLILILH